MFYLNNCIIICYVFQCVVSFPNATNNFVILNLFIMSLIVLKLNCFNFSLNPIFLVLSDQHFLKTNIHQNHNINLFVKNSCHFMRMINYFNRRQFYNIIPINAMIIKTIEHQNLFSVLEFVIHQEYFLSANVTLTNKVMNIQFRTKP